MITYRSSAKFDKQAAVILISQDQIKSKKFNFSHKQLKNQVEVLVRSNQFTGEDGQIFPLIINKQVLLCVGVGKKKDSSLTALRVALRKALFSTLRSLLMEIAVITHD